MGKVTDDEIPECDGCRFPGLPLETYTSSPMSRFEGPKHLCKLCASTFIGNSVDYPEQYDDKDTMQLVGYCTNLILQRLNQIEHRIDLLRRKVGDLP